MAMTAPGRGRGVAVALAVSLALTTTTVGADALAAEPAPEAAAKKKKKRKKKCNSREQSPLFNALSCTRLSRTIPGEPPTPTGNEVYDFCRGNTYRYRETGFGSNGLRYVTTYRGRWKVISSTSGSSGVSGAIQYTVIGFRSVYDDGTAAETPPPSLLSGPVAFGPFGVDFQGASFLRGKAPC
jgi:hypothetical protein